MTALEWLAAIKAKYPERPVSRRTVFNWQSGKTKAPEWALKLRNEK